VAVTVVVVAAWATVRLSVLEVAVGKLRHPSRRGEGGIAADGELGGAEVQVPAPLARVSVQRMVCRS